MVQPQLLNGLVAVFALVGALFWTLAATTRVGPVRATQGSDHDQFLGVLRRQARWNSSAAWCAAIAALIQTFSLLQGMIYTWLWL